MEFCFNNASPFCGAAAAFTILSELLNAYEVQTECKMGISELAVLIGMLESFACGRDDIINLVSNSRHKN